MATCPVSICNELQVHVVDCKVFDSSLLSVTEQTYIAVFLCSVVLKVRDSVVLTIESTIKCSPIADRCPLLTLKVDIFSKKDCLALECSNLLVNLLGNPLQTCKVANLINALLWRVNAIDLATSYLLLADSTLLLCATLYGLIFPIAKCNLLALTIDYNSLNLWVCTNRHRNVEHSSCVLLSVVESDDNSVVYIVV